MRTTFWRRSGAVAGATVLAAALPVIALSGPADAATTINKSFTYSCNFVVDLSGTDSGAFIPLGDFDTKVGVSFTAPDLVKGGTVPVTPVGVKLTLDDSLHGITVDLGGTNVTGASEDAQLEVKPASGASEKYTVNGLSVTKSPIPQDKAQPWAIDINGSSPEIPIPDTSSLELLAPDVFTVPATVFKDSGDIAFRTILTCTAPTNRSLGTLSVADVAPTDPTPDPTDDPTTAPTADPTTDPTDDPTTDPTDDPTDGSGVGNGGGTINPVNDRDTVAASNDALPNTGAPNQLAMIGLLGAALLLGGGGLVARRSVIARHKA